MTFRLRITDYTKTQRPLGCVCDQAHCGWQSAYLLDVPGFNGVSEVDGGQGIAVDAFGQAYVTGFDYSGGLPSIIFRIRRE